MVDQPQFLETYFKFWRAALESYRTRDQSSIYWLTNGCGQPNPRPPDWPRRTSASGFESISDSKTSVGMDRTDDLKKATYQVLKMGTEGKYSELYDLKVGVVSNIHAVRHFDEYLALVKDIVWTRDLPTASKWFNLFDGIVTLTSVYARDSWISKMFSF